jgi:hypothetical protein
VPLERFAFNLKRKTGIHFCAQCSNIKSRAGEIIGPGFYFIDAQMRRRNRFALARDLSLFKRKYVVAIAARLLGICASETE